MGDRTCRVSAGSPGRRKIGREKAGNWEPCKLLEGRAIGMHGPATCNCNRWGGCRQAIRLGRIRQAVALAPVFLPRSLADPTKKLSEPQFRLLTLSSSGSLVASPAQIHVPL